MEIACIIRTIRVAFEQGNANWTAGQNC